MPVRSKRSVIRKHAQEVQEEFQCPICKEQDKQLRVYPECQHFACTDCIDGILAANPDRRSNGRRQFSCPLCRKVITIPSGGLPIHQAAHYMREKALQLEAEIEDVYANPNELRAQQPTPNSNQHSKQKLRQPKRAIQHREQQLNNTVDVNQNEEQRRLQRVDQCYEEIVEGDVRCDWNCNDCGDECSQHCLDSFCKPGGERCRSKCRSIHRYCYWLLLPCWAFGLMKIGASCIKAFQDERFIDMEKSELKPLRDEAWQLVLSRQRTIFPFCFQVLWSFWLIIVFGCCIGLNLYDIVTEVGSFIPVVIAICFNACGFILWITFAIINFIRYKPEGSEIKGESRVVSYFCMEQIQQYLSELCIYPQLCISCMFLLTNYNTIRGIPFYLCSVSLVFLFAVRIYTIVKLRESIRVFFVRLVLFSVGEFLVTLLWLATLSAFSWPEWQHMPTYDILQEILTRSVLCAYIFCHNTLNMVMFYISHLYEITLQCGINVMRLAPSKFDSTKQLMIKLTQETPLFRKNMYPMALAKYGTLLYFSMVPVAAVFVTGSLSLGYTRYYSDNISFELWMVTIWLSAAASVVHIIVNAKSVLLCASGHFTVLTFIGLLVLCIIASAICFALIYGPIFAVIAYCLPCLLIYLAKRN